MFFFEKKNQKTFVPFGGATLNSAALQDIKGFCCVFSKKKKFFTSRHAGD
jgi:hypothetical protein